MVNEKWSGNLMKGGRYFFANGKILTIFDGGCIIGSIHLIIKVYEPFNELTP